MYTITRRVCLLILFWTSVSRMGRLTVRYQRCNGQKLVSSLLVIQLVNSYKLVRRIKKMITLASFFKNSKVRAGVPYFCFPYFLFSKKARMHTSLQYPQPLLRYSTLRCQTYRRLHLFEKNLNKSKYGLIEGRFPRKITLFQIKKEDRKSPPLYFVYLYFILISSRR